MQNTLGPCFERTFEHGLDALPPPRPPPSTNTATCAVTCCTVLTWVNVHQVIPDGNRESKSSQRPMDREARAHKRTLPCNIFQARTRSHFHTPTPETLRLPSTLRRSSRKKTVLLPPHTHTTYPPTHPTHPPKYLHIRRQAHTIHDGSLPPPPQRPATTRPCHQWRSVRGYLSTRSVKCAYTDARDTERAPEVCLQCQSALICARSA